MTKSLPLRFLVRITSNPFFRHYFFVLFIVFGGGAVASVSAATLVVPSGGDLQAAINAANFGDTIILAAGGTYKAPGQQVSFTLPLKPGGSGTSADYITITTSNLSGLPSGRVSAIDAANMAKIVALGGRGAFQLAPNAKYWKFVGLEITNTSSGTANEHVQDLIGSTDAAYSRTNKPAHFIVDRCYVHPQEDGLPTTDPNYNFRTVSHGIVINAADVTITNSRGSGFFGAYRHAPTIAIDSEGVAYSMGPGPLDVENNYIDAWYAGMLIGGTDTDSDNFGTISGTVTPTTSAFSVSVSGGTMPLAGDMIAVANPGKEYSACKVA